MANTTKQLTNTEVKQAKPRDKEYYLADGKGLQLRVRPNGTKQWLLKYFKPYTKKRTNISLGQYPATSLSKARKETLEYRELLADDVDPREYRLEQKQIGREACENTLYLVYQKWLKTKEGAWSKSYRKRLTQALELHIMPALGAIPISKINAPNTIKIMEPIADRRALETVRKLCRWINEIMVFATNSGLVDANRLSGIGKAFKPPDVTNMPAIKPEFLPQFLKDLDQAHNEVTTKCLIFWLLHTMARPSEGAKAKWGEIDMENRLWRIDPSRMKKRRPHIVPLTDQTMQLLETMKPISQHREYIFPSRSNPKAAINSETPNTAIKRMGYKGVFVAHGVRSLASTVLNEQEFPADIIEVSQSRVGKDSVRAIYNRAEYLEQRRVMMQWWSDYIEEAAKGKEPFEGIKSKKHLKMVQI
ncbi:MAG: tyrosine-type recombinase/integrase [Gammaproteobacteria bacterium]|jgi:integrase|nr:tyrosine-type recombinase/integrase [Gammaproteobacteria bacterium]MBT3858612.1 tyrosine-type recombinase/integrase [Gammaproteobacteria bacterium]MBT3987747.1 tyrosine-type recombinase/integrase [Gammaproteobacteria bacterium]MBT4256407.1 tyrosine-type recombinase/integrase [Gammaproteobacteria bacterium]MBT4583229.1 tyrosine-type recombinase/integrase [Gammaproteobacteria bacterium]